MSVYTKQFLRNKASSGEERRKKEWKSEEGFVGLLLLAYIILHYGCFI